MANPEEQAVLRVVILPWLAHGHLSPFLELAKRLSSHNILVHLCSTPVNLTSIKQQLLPKSEAFPSLKLVELHLPTGVDSKLRDPHLHTTKHLPSHLMPALKTAFDLAEPAFSQILQDLSPDLLIYDFIQPWAPRAANKLNIPAIQLLTTGAASTSFFYHYLKKPGERFPFPEMGDYDNDMDRTNAMMLTQRSANGVTDGDRLMQCIALSSDFVAIKTFREIESKYLDYLSSLTGKEMVPVGPLVPDTIDEEHEPNRSLIQWLDMKERSSVLYASFGSEYFLQEEEIEEIARGLETCKVSYIWVVRFPASESDHKLKNLVNVGQDVGLMIEGWAAQREILSHRSTGAFLTHCGWSSVMEAMRFGVPIVGMPLQLDQPLNAKLVEELGVGVEIKGAEYCNMRRVYKSHEIAKGINEIMVKSETSLDVTRKAKAMAELMGFKGNQEISLLVEKMALLCTKNKGRVSPDLSSLVTE